MLARVHSSAVVGIDAFPLSVEVDCSTGLDKFRIVGLPDVTVRESEGRVKAALRNSGYRWPAGETVVNLAPADMRKAGSALDLPIALGLLAASGQIDGARFNSYVLVGELGLDGAVRPVAGTLCIAFAARASGLRGLVVPLDNAKEGGVAEGVDVVAVGTLREAAAFMSGAEELLPHVTDTQAFFAQGAEQRVDLSEVKGQAHVKRALTVAAAGGHNLLMVGPPGTGKSMLAKRLPGILPAMTLDEALETTRVYSVAQLTGPEQALIAARPFRSPHHTSSTVAMAGGGAGPQPFPGEISLAHNGVLFLDELPEFNRSALEVLRQPLEEGLVHVRRAMYSVTFPSRFMLVTAMNPCPCGYATDPRKPCTCSLAAVQRYRSRLSGPLLDRIDLHVDVPPLSFGELADDRPSTPTSAEVRQQVTAARQRQEQRYDGLCHCNAHLEPQAVREFCRTTSGGRSLLEKAIDQLGFSARAYDRILRVARTLADLDGAEAIEEPHIAEAVQYRTFDRAS